ncbi:energy transducer TonB [Terriglobus aquaticus]|uniref:Energy transducer TonB n=1 Tax=Terriglobus aquaticus TaxID=940139 RepID=A0ABW9KPA5_9BACT|nr:energy transducer TonB [Terriglobus aquaticus]
MPTVETPPEHEAPQPPPDPGSDTPRSSRGRSGNGRRYDYYDTHELITLIDQIDDERARARFREAVYLAVILWLVMALAYIFLPRWLPHRPVLIVQDRNPKELTYLETPPNLKDMLRQKPAPHISEHTAEAQTPRPTKAPTPPEPRAGHPEPPAPRPQPQPAQPAPQQPQAQQQPPQQQTHVTPQPTPHPNVPPIVADAPAPSSQRQPNFNNQQSASSAIADAARSSRSQSGLPDQQGDYGNAPGKQGQGKAGYEILSDTQGVDFGRYIQRLLAQVRRAWLPLIPEECNSPLFKQGITGVRFTIQPDGRITGMNLDYSTHDDAINRAAWGSLKSIGSAPPLPKEFHGPNLELRIEFRVNKDRDLQ